MFISRMAEVIGRNDFTSAALVAEMASVVTEVMFTRNITFDYGIIEVS